LVLSALTATGDQRSSVDFKPINQSLNHTLLQPVGQPTNQLINQQTNHQFIISVETHNVSTLPETLLQKCNIVVYLSSQFFGQNVGKKSDFDQNWQSVGSRPKQIGKICFFHITEMPKPRTGTR
jgi:hypothetical protein